MRMRDYWRGDITHRELWVLIQQSKPDSRFMSALARCDEQREVDEAQARRDARDVALEAQMQRNIERGLIDVNR